ncbi:hypothetical protein ABW20_dc0101143 [Dactylellina cionopaga]|nr:hypothetical protein ABW20_dc0101143 [Dactylellina cionopaga]
MAHATTASASSQPHANVDARLKNLKKNILPDYPLRLTQANDHTDARRHPGNCKNCGQNKDSCFCYAHHTFLSREEMTTYSDRASSFDSAVSSKPLPSKPTATPATQSYGGAASRPGKKTISLGEYSKKRMQDGGTGAGRSSTPKDAASPAEANLMEKKLPASRAQLSKRDAVNVRAKSPSSSSKNDHNKNRRSLSPSDRLHEKPTRKDDREHKLKSERLREQDKLPILPKMLSPLPDELNRLVDEYERRHPDLVKDRDADSLSMDDEPLKKYKKGEKTLEKISSHPEFRSSSSRIENEGRSSKSERRIDRFEHSAKEAEPKSQLQDQSPRQGFKVPAKRPPGDIVAKSRDIEKEPQRLLARLHYGVRNIGKVKKILKSEVDRSKCQKCVTGKDEGYSAETSWEKGLPREKSPHLPTRVSMTTLKATPNLKNTLSGKSATPNRRLAGSSERPRSSEQGSTSRLSTAQLVDRDMDDLGDNETLRADSEALLALGIKLKHKADAALGVKNPEEANLNHALVYACHCVM